MGLYNAFRSEIVSPDAREAVPNFPPPRSGAQRARGTARTARGGGGARRCITRGPAKGAPRLGEWSEGHEQASPRGPLPRAYRRGPPPPLRGGGCQVADHFSSD